MMTNDSDGHKVKLSSLCAGALADASDEKEVVQVNGGISSEFGEWWVSC